MEKKTLLVTSFHPLISRNIIATPFFSMLSNIYRVVVIVPNFKVSYFEKEFKNRGFIIEGIEVGTPIRTKRVGMLKRLNEALPKTVRASLGRRLTLTGTRKNFYYYYFFYLPASFLGHSFLLMRLVRIVDYYISPRGRFFSLFEKYKPELIFSTDIQNEHDVALMQDAKQKGIPSVSMVRSWDNLVTRGIRFVPKYIIVHNEIIKNQAVHLYGISPRIIHVTGIPHYDRYIKGPRKTKEEFFADTALDVSKKTILFFPLCDYRVVRGGGTKTDDVFVDKKIVEILERSDANVIIRFPPNETVSLGDFKKPKNFFYDTPGYVFENNLITTREVTHEDNERLISELAYSDVVVSGPSTATIDAAVFDVPIVLADIMSGTATLAGQIYEYKSEHIVNIIKTGGVKIARSADELLKLVTDYFADRTLDRNGRKMIVQEQCFKLDGRGTERVVEVVKNSLLKNETFS